MAVPDTTDGSNWTVAVFRCPRKNWTEILSSFFSELDKQKLSLIPHYTIRSFEPSINSFIISFRILRKQENEGAVKSLIQKLIKGYDHEIDPKAGSSPISITGFVMEKELKNGQRRDAKF